MAQEAGISLGSNLGDRVTNLVRARDLMAQIPGVQFVAQSGLYETEPVDVPEVYQALQFLNAVAIFEVSIPLEAWSQAIHEIEEKLLRKRSEIRHAPRTIDLDLLYYGNETANAPHLHLPHPQCLLRRFVCEPLSEVRPQLILPGETRTIAEVLSGLPLEPCVRQVRVASAW